MGTLDAQTSKKPKKKKEVSIIKKGWDDVTTRNNYYFNAKRIYDEMMKNHQKNVKIDFNQMLPFYTYDLPPALSGNSGQLQQIIIKTGVTLQRHDYSRWKDNCYTLLGKAYFLRGDLDSALTNFQYVSTALRGKFNDKKAAISQKSILKAKAARQKEMEKLANDKKKEIEKNQKSKQEEIAKSAEEKQKRMDAVAKAKEKELQRKIKAKQKMIKQKAKGKYKPPAPSVNKSTPSNSSATTPKKKRKSASDILDRISEGVTIEGGTKGNESDLKKADQKVKAMQYTKEKLEAGNVEDSLTQKQKETLDRLTLWEKIKHLQSRPDALVWMTKTFIQQKNYRDAESIIEYCKTLVKLRKSQWKDIYVVRAYYFKQLGQNNFSAEALSEAIPLMKKKAERNYYNFLLAQLSSKDSAQKAYGIYKNLFEKGKDEIISFQALEKMYQMLQTRTVGNEDLSQIIRAYQKYAKSKTVGDQALYTLANLSLIDADTTKAIAQLQKAVSWTQSDPEQKAKALNKLGEIYYEQYQFKNSYTFFDSAYVMISKDTVLKKDLEIKVKALKEIVMQQDIAIQQDSLLALSKMTREELAQYIKEQNKIERKTKRKDAVKNADDATFVSGGIGNNSNFNTSQDQFVSKGQWYFYNVDLRTKGFNEFKLNWGERPYINNWRRAEAIQQNMLGVSQLVKENTDSNSTKAPEQVLRIPTTDEELLKSYNLIAKSYWNRAQVFYNDLKNYPAAFLCLDSLYNRFPKSQLIPSVYYNKMLMYSDMDDLKKTEEYAEKLIAEFPDHPLTKKILQNRDIKYVKKEDKSTSEAETYYASLYDLYQSGKYPDVIQGRIKFYEKYPEDATLFPKVNFLEALSFAQQGNIEDYKKALENIIKTYPKSIEAAQAKMYLTSLVNISQKTSDRDTSSIEDSTNTAKIYTYKDGFHFILILLKNKKLNNSTSVDAINEAVEQAFPNGRIKASNSYLNSDHPMILVKRFDNIEDARKGISALQNSDNLTIRDILSSNEILLISQDNFKELFTSKKIEEYKSFYQENYK